MLDASIKIVGAKLFHQKKRIFVFAFGTKIFWKNFDMLFNLKHRFIFMAWWFILAFACFFEKKTPSWYLVLLPWSIFCHFIGSFYEVYCHLHKKTARKVRIEKKLGSALFDEKYRAQKLTTCSRSNAIIIAIFFWPKIFLSETKIFFF